MTPPSAPPTDVADARPHGHPQPLRRRHGGGPEIDRPVLHPLDLADRVADAADPGEEGGAAEIERAGHGRSRRRRDDRHDPDPLARQRQFQRIAQAQPDAAGGRGRIDPGNRQIGQHDTTALLQLVDADDPAGDRNRPDLPHQHGGCDQGRPRLCRGEAQHGGKQGKTDQQRPVAAAQQRPPAAPEATPRRPRSMPAARRAARNSRPRPGRFRRAPRESSAPAPPRSRRQAGAMDCAIQDPAAALKPADAHHAR